ncbi:MAG: hypothetical protein DMD96_30265 [Candidatus Rokuibacteriota bacterium]|nr:MAG: hypothetical protein DMD96_30265 [Candidatus Rokubacteria bacterium]
MIRAWLIALLLAAAPGIADGQVFLASRSNPEFTLGPLFVRATVTPELGAVTLDVLWSLVIPPTTSGGAIAQDLFLLWPNSVDGDSTAGPPDPALAAYVKTRGFTPIMEGRLPLFAQSLYRIGEELPPEPIRGGAPFVTFVRQSGPLGLTAPVTYVRIPWTPLLANRTFLMNLRMELTDLVKQRKATWIEDAFWGPQHSISVTFNDVRPRALFPVYFEHRDRVVRLADDPSQLIVNFRDAEHLKIYEIFPRTAGRRRSETLESTEEISLFLDSSEGISPQVLTAQFGYFRGMRSWAPVLIPIVFFMLGNLAMPLFMMIARRAGAMLASRFQVGPGGATRQTGVVLARDTLARIVPGSTTYQEVLRLGGPDAEEHEQLTAAPGRRTLVYRGRRVVPQGRRGLGWLATVSSWSVEHHEVEITLERDVVTDVQARVRRSPIAPAEAG